MRKLVIGSTGFIGRELVTLLSEKYPGQVRAMIRSRGKLGSLAYLWGVEFVEGDVLDRESLDSAMRDHVDTVYYFAAVTGNQKNKNNLYWRVNVEGTRNAVAAAEKAGVSRFVLCSGLGTIVGEPGSYMETRWEMEEAVRRSKMAWTILQPSILFGEGSEFFEAQARIMKLLPVAALLGGGNTRFQPIHVTDVARASIEAAESEAKIGKTIELGGSEYYTYRELVNLMLATIKIKRLKLPLPMWAARLNATLFNLLPKPPLTKATLELLAYDNISADREVIKHQFGFDPDLLQPYLAKYGIKV
ncbi:MAG: complex I NDUFA9 subunit family protein [Chloroflexota bacterium]|nr:complex I NDUFA9 subunit family protein [Chloroflexota bacterium]